MKGVELHGRVRYAVQIEGLSHREAARQFGIGPRTKMVKFSVPTHSKLSAIGVPLGGVTAKVTFGAILRPNGFRPIGDFGQGFIPGNLDPARITVRFEPPMLKQQLKDPRVTWLAAGAEDRSARWPSSLPQGPRPPAPHLCGCALECAGQGAPR
jgi:hypothetical protein